MTKLNGTRTGLILKALEEGNSRRTAAELAGISPRTLQRWLKRGRDAEDEGCAELLEHVHNAEACAEREMSNVVMQAAREGEWRAAAWWLERRFPGTWAKQQRIAIKPEESGPISWVVQIGGSKTASDSDKSDEGTKAIQA